MLDLWQDLQHYLMMGCLSPYILPECNLLWMMGAEEKQYAFKALGEVTANPLVAILNSPSEPKDTLVAILNSPSEPKDTLVAILNSPSEPKDTLVAILNSPSEPGESPSFPVWISGWNRAMCPLNTLFSQYWGHLDPRLQPEKDVVRLGVTT